MSTNRKLWDAVVNHLSLDEGYNIGVSTGQLHLSGEGRWAYVRNPGDVTTWSVEMHVPENDPMPKYIRVVADADRAVRVARNFMTGAAERAPFQVELVWNREFRFARHGEPLDTLDAAQDRAMDLMNMGESVKKVRVVDADGEVVWRFG